MSAIVSSLGNPITERFFRSLKFKRINDRKLFSWGEFFERLDAILTLGEFLNHTFKGLVFKKIP